MENELVEYAIDNSYNPPVIDIYCGKCDAYVESIGISENIPLKKDVLCCECQDELDE